MVGYVARQTERQMTLTEWLSRTGCSSACPLVFGVVWGGNYRVIVRCYLVGVRHPALTGGALKLNCCTK